MKKYDIAILTDYRYVNPKEINSYNGNVLLEDRLVQEALESKGFTVIRVDWANKDFDWSSVGFSIFRSTWDYMNRFPEFEKWFHRVRHLTNLINPAEVIEWNMDKHYLKDLVAKGVKVPKTYYAIKGDKITLQAFFAKGGWKEAVIKPTVSAGAKHTYRIDSNNIEEYEETFQRVLQEEDMMIQPFLKNVMERGEVSLMVMGGKFTHAVLKVAKPGDFRVQDNWGGTVQSYEPTQAEMQFVEAVVAACDYDLLYARIDIANDNQGQVTLIELELFEPELWFRIKPESAEVFADAVENYITDYNLK